MKWYDPKDAETTIPEGLYEATVIAAEHKTSSKGNPMCELQLVVYAGDREVKMKDWLVAGSGTWKIKAFAEALNAGDEFRAQTFDPVNYTQKNLRVEVITRKSNDPKYGDQNGVKDYQPTEMGAAANPAARPAPTPAAVRATAHKPMTDDDIPFD